MSCNRIRSIAILLILVTLIACANAQPGDGTEGLENMDWSLLTEMGEQFSNGIAHSQFAHLTTTPMPSNNRPNGSPPRSHPPPQPVPQPIDDHFGCVSPWGMELPDNLGLGIQNIQDPMRTGGSLDTAARSVVHGQEQFRGYNQVQRSMEPGTMASMQRANSVPLTGTPHPMSVPLPPTEFGAIGTPMNSLLMEQRFAPQLPLQPTWPPGPLTMQSQFMDPFNMNGYDMMPQPSMLPMNPNLHIPQYGSQQVPPPTSVPEILSSDVTNNYNFHQGVTPNHSVGMLGWIGRAPTAGDRAVPRLTTDRLMDNNRLFPPEPKSANRSPTSASTTGSSGGRSRRDQWPAGNLNCHWCSSSFTTQGDLTHHLRSHAPYMSRQHVCMHCEKRFQYRKDLARHLPKHDPNRPRFYCSIGNCKYHTKGFGRQDHLDRHMGSQHRFAEMQREDTPLRGRTPSQ